MKTLQYVAHEPSTNDSLVYFINVCGLGLISNNLAFILLS